MGTEGAAIGVAFKSSDSGLEISVDKTIELTSELAVPGFVFKCISVANTFEKIITRSEQLKHIRYKSHFDRHFLR